LMRTSSAVRWAVARERGRTKAGRRRAALEILALYRAYRRRCLRTAAATVLQRRWRRRQFERVMVRLRRRAARQRARAEQARSALLARSPWTPAQVGLLVALEAVHGTPSEPRDWLLRARWLGTATDGEVGNDRALRKLRDLIPGLPQSMKSIQVPWMLEERERSPLSATGRNPFL
jgi:hypothetical protein